MTGTATHRDAKTRRRLAPSTNVIESVNERLGDLRRAERRVADFILDNSRRVITMNLGTLAREAGVSEPTAIRFCRTVGCDGFSDLKIQLAQAVAVGSPHLHSTIRPADDLITVADKVVGSSVDALRALRKELDLDAVSRAVDAIAEAGRLEIVAFGLSSAAAFDAQQKFMRLGVAATFLLDQYLQRMSIATLGRGDVVLVISSTGEGHDVVLTATKARERRTTVLAITRSDCALARLADIHIPVNQTENAFACAPLTARLAHLTVVDVLATAVAMNRGPRGAELIKRVKDSTGEVHLVAQEDK